MYLSQDRFQSKPIVLALKKLGHCIIFFSLLLLSNITLKAQTTCTLSVTCPTDTAIVINCLDSLPEPAKDKTEFEALPGNPEIGNNFCDTLIISSIDTTNNGEGCIMDTLIITRIYTISDDSSSQTCTISYHILDSIPPVLMNPPVDTVVDCDALIPFNTPTFSDNCTSASTILFSESRSNGSCPSDFTLTRTWIAVDACDNQDTVTQTISIQDTTAPEVVCRNLTLRLDRNGTANLFPTVFYTRVSDNCTDSGNLGLNASQINFSCNDLVQNGSAGCATQVPVIFNVSDECGNTDTCIAMITLIDDIAPTFTNCPGSFSINLDPGACRYPYYFSLEAVDNCDANPTITQTAGPSSGTFLEIGTTYFSFEVEDNCGNTNTCSYNVTVNEFPNPIGYLACNNSLQISVDQNCKVQVTANMLLEGGPYGCYEDYLIELFFDPARTQAIPSSPILDSDDLNRVIYTRVIDPDNGNSCTGSIILRDYSVPSLTCQDTTVDCTDDISPEALGFPIPSSVSINSNTNQSYTLTGFDPCGTATLTYTDQNIPDDCGTINNVIIRTWTVRDEAGNSSRCTQTINTRRVGFSNVIPPPNPDGIRGPALICEDRCSINPVDLPDCGTSPIGWNVLPVGHLFAGHPSPYDDLYPCNGLVRCSGTGVPTGFCSDVQATFSDTRIDICSQGSSESCYKILRRWTLIDWCSYEIHHIDQTIKVDDNQAPQISGIEDLTISVDVWSCDTDWEATIPNLTDNCASTPLDYTVTADRGLVQVMSNGQFLISNLSIGTYTITYTAIDCCGNSRDSIIQLTVIDDIPPVAVCDGNTVASISRSANPIDPRRGITKVFASSLDNGSYDICQNDVFFKILRMDEYDGNGDGKFPETVQDGDWKSSACSEANGDDDLRTRPAVYQGVQSYFDDYALFCCADIDAGPVQVVFRVYDIDPQPYTFGYDVSTRNLVPSGANPDDYAGVLPERHKPGQPLYNHYNDCMVLVTIQDNLPPYVLAPPPITVSCDFWFPFDEDMPNNYTDELDAIFGKVITEPTNILTRDSIFIQDRVCPLHPKFSLHAPSNPAADPCYDDIYNIYWGRDGYVLDNCGVTLEQTISPNLHCARGQIIRSWRAGDEFGNWSNIARQIITIIDCKEFYVPSVCWRSTPNDIGSCDFVNGVYQNKLIEWPCDVEVNRCQQNGIDALTPDNLPIGLDQDRTPRYDEDNCNLLGRTYVDRIFTFTDNACIKIFRDWTVIDWCLYEDFQAGSYSRAYEWEWTQVIKLLNTIGPTFDNCTDQTFCGYGDPMFPNNNQCVGEVTLEPNITDDCSELADIRTHFKIDAFNDGTFDYLGYSDNHLVNPFGFGANALIYSATMPNANGKYPVGEHKIIWSAEDGCGNITSCEYLFTIQDCKPPTTYCRTGISTIPMPSQAGGFVDIWASDYNIGSYDNCTDSTALIYSFSTDPSDLSRRFLCADAPGLYNLTVYVWDLDPNGQALNFATCDVQIQLSDCLQQTTYQVMGQIENEFGEEAANVMVSISGDSSTQMLTTIDGTYEFELLEAQNYVVSPIKDVNHRNGVSTFDLVQISKHITGQQELDSPYKMIAADVNNSGSISTFDIIDLRKLILYINTEFPDNTSWRFIDADFLFPNSDDPFASSFPESYDINGLDQNMEINFVAIKTGDVNGSANPSSFVNNAQTRSSQILELTTNEKRLVPNETIRVDITANNFSEILGYQFTLDFDDAIHIEGISGKSLGLQAGNFGHLEDVLTSSWHSNKGESLDKDDVLFSMTLSTKEEMLLSEAFSISSAFTRAEAYNNDGLMDVLLTFNKPEDDFTLHQNKPNPFTSHTVISFTLSTPSETRLTIYDLGGKLLKEISHDYGRGYYEIAIDKGELNTNSSLLYYKLETAHKEETRKMIIIE